MAVSMGGAIYTCDCCGLQSAAENETRVPDNVTLIGIIGLPDPLVLCNSLANNCASEAVKKFQAFITAYRASANHASNKPHPTGKTITV